MAELLRYFVEGECELKMLTALMKEAPCLVRPGKIEVFNMVGTRLSSMRAKTIRRGTKVILVYDIDSNRVETLDLNLRILSRYAYISPEKIVHVQSIRCFEDEVVRSTSLRNINACFGTQGKEEFKRRFIAHKNVMGKLADIGFDIGKLWCSECPPDSCFSKYKNAGRNILLLFSPKKRNKAKENGNG